MPRVPERLRIAQVASGDQRRVLFEGLLRDYDPEIRIAAAEELNRIGSAQSIAPLVDALSDGDIFVRTESHRALMHIGHPAIEAMLSRVSSRDYRNRPTLAALLLASITPETEQFLPKKLLEDILRETRFVRCLGVLCVERVTVPSYPPLAKMARVSGEVFVEFSIKDGHPEDITTFGHPLLIETVVNALNHYQFAPENTRERYHITVKFDVIGSSAQAGTTAYDFVFPNYVRSVARAPLVETQSIAWEPSNIRTAQPAAAADR